MAVGIIIHISVGEEKRTEFFSEDRLTIGSADSCDLQIQTAEIAATGVWFELENTDGVYRITKFDPSLSLILNGQPIRRFIAVEDGDILTIGNTGVSFGFFAISEKRSLIKANRAQ